MPSWFSLRHEIHEDNSIKAIVMTVLSNLVLVHFTGPLIPFLTSHT